MELGSEGSKEAGWLPGAGILFPISVVAVTALSLGYDAGVMSGAIGPMRRSFGMDPWEEGVTMGCLNVIAAPGALLASWLAD